MKIRLVKRGHYLLFEEDRDVIVSVSYCLIPYKRAEYYMLNTIPKVIVLALLAVLAGCSTAGNILGGIQADYDKALRKADDRRFREGFKESSDSATAFAKKLCEIKGSDLQADAKQRFMAGCIDYVYTLSLIHISEPTRPY